MKIIVTIIPTNLFTNLLLLPFCPFLETKNKNRSVSKLLVWHRKKFLLFDQSRLNLINFYVSVFFRLYQIVISGYLADSIISYLLKIEWKILENTGRRSKEGIFHFFGIILIRSLLNLLLKLGVFQDGNIPSRQLKKNSKAHSKFSRKD